MGRKKKIIEGLEITGIATEGRGFGKKDGKVVFVDNAVPGDVVTVKLKRNRSDYAQGFVLKLEEPSDLRIDAFCAHFEDCGGCKWQHLNYEQQLAYKEQIAKDCMQRIGKVSAEERLPILGSEKTQFYRNKMEYSFAARRWLSETEIKNNEEILDRRGLGLFVPATYNRVVDIYKCYLQDDLANEMRNFVRALAQEHDLSFFDPDSKEGWLRNLILRNNIHGDWMVVLSVATMEEDALKLVLDPLKTKFPQIKSLQYVINPKGNSTLYDLDIVPYSGEDHLIEYLGDLKFKISPKSFFQTNTGQALRLYEVARDFAGVQKGETLYDLYTGTGSIALFMADTCEQVVGIETVPDAIVDAKFNAQLNGIENCHFVSGDVKDLLKPSLWEAHGRPDVVITDPPRAGMHQDVVHTLLKLEPSRIVYVSCNPATQARDIQLLSEKYRLTKVQAIDMFPHTFHIEQVVLLTLDQ